MKPKTLTWSWNRAPVIEDASANISAENSNWHKQIIPMCPCSKLRHERSVRHQLSSKQALITQQHNSQNHYGWTAYWLTGGPNMPRMTMRARPGRAAYGWARGGRKAGVSGSGGCEGECWCCHSPPWNALPFLLIMKHWHFGTALRNTGWWVCNLPILGDHCTGDPLHNCKFNERHPI